MPKATTSAAATNALGVRYVVDGPAGIKSKLNEIIRCFDYLFPRQSADIISEVTPQGAVYRLRTPQTTTRTRTTLDPFQPTPIVGAAKVTITPGTVNSGGSVMPKIGGVALDTVPAPELTLGTGDRSIYLECAVDTEGNVTAVDVLEAATASLPDPFQEDDTARLVIWTGTVTGTDIVETSRPIRTSVAHARCGGAHHRFGRT